MRRLPSRLVRGGRGGAPRGVISMFVQDNMADRLSSGDLDAAVSPMAGVAVPWRPHCASAAVVYLQVWKFARVGGHEPVPVFHGVAHQPWRQANGQTKGYGGWGDHGTADRDGTHRHCLGVRPGDTSARPRVRAISSPPLRPSQPVTPGNASTNPTTCSTTYVAHPIHGAHSSRTSSPIMTSWTVSGKKGRGKNRAVTIIQMAAVSLYNGRLLLEMARISMLAYM
jgi:hypothetical protein